MKERGGGAGENMESLLKEDMNLSWMSTDWKHLPLDLPAATHSSLYLPEDPLKVPPLVPLQLHKRLVAVQRGAQL